MLTEGDGPEVAASFGLGAGGRLTGPVARGQLGQIWRLDVDGTSWAVKEWFASPDGDAVEANLAFAEAALAAGVFTPRSRLSVWGTVLADVEGNAVRVLEWVDLALRSRRLDPAEVGRTVAAVARLLSREPRRRNQAAVPRAEGNGNTQLGQEARLILSPRTS